MATSEDGKTEMQKAQETSDTMIVETKTKEAGNSMPDSLVEKLFQLETKMMKMDSVVGTQGKKIRHQDKEIKNQKKEITKANYEIETLKDEVKKKTFRIDELEESMENVKDTVEKHGRFSAFWSWSTIKKGVVTEIDKALHSDQHLAIQFNQYTNAIRL